MRQLGKKVVGLVSATLVLVSMSGFVAGCNGNGGMDGWNEAEFETEQNGEFREDMEEFGEETGEAMEKTGEDAGEVVEETAEELEEAGEETRERIERNGETEYEWSDESLDPDAGRQSIY